MKKILYSAAALALAFFAGSCQQENLEPVVSGNTVTYTVQVADAVATRALGDDITAVNELVYEVYRTEAEGVMEFSNADNLLYHKTAEVKNGVATIEIEFVNDQNFTVLFWAHTAGNTIYDVDDLTEVTIDTSAVANNVNAQAFVGRDFVRDCVSDANGTVILHRPVSQLNIATTPESLVFEAQVAGGRETVIGLEGSSVTVNGLSTTFNIATLTPGEIEDVDYVYTETMVPTKDGNYETLEVNGTPYTYVSMNYVGFAPTVGANLTVSYIINTTEGNIDNEILNVPVKPNYRTSIVGNLITSKTDYQITLHKDWYTPEEVVECWNGSEINAPKPSATDADVYEIEYPSELAWLAAAVNGTLPETRAAIAPQDFAGKTFVLTEDIDLGGHEWTPIGSSANPFQGVFDGNGKTVENLVVTGYNSNVGLFGNTNSGEIKNLTVKNAKVSGRLNVGVVAGQPYTSKYTNITVTGHVEVNGMAYVGAVGGKNAYADWTNITVNVDETSYVKANSVENGTAYRTYVGGVVGFNGEGGHSFTNITSNINVEGSTCDVGGLFGIAHYGNQFVNCVCTGNVEIYAAEEAAEAQEIGGIAGVWHNQSGYQVTFTRCSFEGSLEVNVEGVDLSDNTITGAPYSSTGTGKLVIDGKELSMVAEIPAEIDLGEGNTVIVPALSSDHKVIVKGNGTLLLNGTTITSTEGAALELAAGANVTLCVNEAVALTGATHGVNVPADATLLVKGKGNFTTIGNAGSGIAGSVVVDGLAHLTAKGTGNHAFGIGGNGETIVIKNSTVDYVSGGHIQPLCINDPKYGKSEPEGGPAIGGAVIKIENSTITKADGGSKSAAIGGQYWQSTDIEIVNSTIAEANGGNSSAGIGGGRYASDSKHNVSIKIKNSDVTATGGQFGAGIGAGYDTHCNGQDYNAVNYIEIDGTSVITAKGGKYAPGIGTGFHSAYLTGSIAEGAVVNAEAGDETFYKDTYSTAQNIGYGVVDPTREFSKDNSNVTFTVSGKVIDAPFSYLVKDKTIEIYTAEGLVAVSKMTINGGVTVVLKSDIDLTGVEFNGLNAFNPESNNTFDGQGHTVSNWTYTGKADDMGFIKNWVGTIKNLTIKKAILRTGGRSAVIVAKPYGNIENCHVEECNFQANYWACGLIAGMHNSGNMTNCTAKNSYIKSTGGTGAITGVLNETAGERTYKSCVVEGCTIDNGGDDPYAGAAIVGLINIDNATVSFEGCAWSGNTYKGTAKDEICGYNAGDNTTVTVK